MSLKPEQIREMAEEELHQKVDALRKELFELKSQVSFGRIEKPHRISLAKKDLARVLTIINERTKQGKK